MRQTFASEEKGPPCHTSVMPEPASIGKGSPKADSASSDPKQAAWTEVTFGADVCDGVPWGGRFYTTNLTYCNLFINFQCFVVPFMVIHALFTVKGGYSHCREDLGSLGW